MDKEIEPEEITEEVDEDVYSEEGRENLVDDDEIEEQEEAFMEGYENENLTNCATCGKLLDEVIEKEIDGDAFRFCCDNCANTFKKKEE